MQLASSEAAAPAAPAAPAAATIEAVLLDFMLLIVIICLCFYFYFFVVVFIFVHFCSKIGKEQQLKKSLIWQETFWVAA